MVENEKENDLFNKKDYSDLMESKYVKKWLKNVESKQERLSLMKNYKKILKDVLG